MPEVVICRASQVCETSASIDDGLKAIADPAACVWINVAAGDQEDIKKIAAAIGLHELTVEDILNTEVRPKLEDFDDYMFVVFKGLEFHADDVSIRTPDFNAVVGRNYIVTSEETGLPALREARDRFAKRPALAERGPSFILYTILDALVDSYFPVMDQIDDIVEDIDDRIFARFEQNVASEIFRWKNLISRLRRHVSPQREMLMLLSSREHDLVPSPTMLYMRDVYDHLIRIQDALDSFRDILQGAIDSYMTQVSNRMNQVMKTLSIVATIMLPLGILTGLFGTNFSDLPGKDSPEGFWIFSGILVAIIAAGIVVFRKLRWF